MSNAPVAFVTSSAILFIFSTPVSPDANGIFGVSNGIILGAANADAKAPVFILCPVPSGAS